MAEIVNLRTVRKRKARAEHDVAAEANRRLHGQPAAIRKAERTRRETEERRLEGHLIERDETR